MLQHGHDRPIRCTHSVVPFNPLYPFPCTFQSVVPIPLYLAMRCTHSVVPFNPWYSFRCTFQSVVPIPPQRESQASSCPGDLSVSMPVSTGMCKVGPSTPIPTSRPLRILQSQQCAGPYPCYLALIRATCLSRRRHAPQPYEIEHHERFPSVDILRVQVSLKKVK